SAYERPRKPASDDRGGRRDQRASSETLVLPRGPAAPGVEPYARQCQGLGRAVWWRSAFLGRFGKIAGLAGPDRQFGIHLPANRDPTDGRRGDEIAGTAH